MPDEPLVRIDLCKTPARQGPGTDLAPPLDAVEPLGLASMGCLPVLTHRATATGRVVSRVRHDTGADEAALFSTADDADLNSGEPYYTAYAAGLLGATPATGVVADPYPAGTLSYVFDYEYLGFVASREQLPFGSPPSFQSVPVGFGNQRRPYPVIVLGGGAEFDGFLPGSRRPYKEYRQLYRIAYCPTDSMTAIYDPGVPEIKSQDSSTGNTFSQSKQVPAGPPPYTVYSANLTMWECHPALVIANGPIVSPSVYPPATNEREPPGFTRKYVFQDFGNRVLPGWGDSDSATYTLLDERPWLVIYATANIGGVTLNGVAGAGFGGTLGPIRLTYFATPPNPFTFTQAFAWSLSPLTTSFTFDIIVGGETVTPATTVIGTGSNPRFYEGYLVGQTEFVPT